MATGVGVEAYVKFGTAASIKHRGLKSLDDWIISKQQGTRPELAGAQFAKSSFVTAIRKSKNRKGLEARTKYIIRSYDNGIFALTRSDTSAARPTLNYGSREAMEIWQVARAATAAPLYFAALKLDNPYSTANMRYYFSDGGFGPANNPCLLGIQELQKVHGSEEHDNVGVVVSVGTAKADSSPGGVNFFVDTVRQLTEEATNANTIAELVESIRQTNYWRFNDLVGLKMELDEWKPNWTFGSRDKCGLTTLETIQNAFNAWALQDVNQTRIQDCARELVARRRARTASTHLWEQYATGATRFRCKHRDCTRTFYTFRDEFEQHFDKKHKGRPNAKEYEDPDFLRWIYPPKA
ncbi:hypothetical protein N0V94_005182 [Neodidymelliopsis sp. IMI 364377]|nr:hypothetical protein N0V94_005182 [Neodidymelliopsis sp. IMI 364377]